MVDSTKPTVPVPKPINQHLLAALVPFATAFTSGAMPSKEDFEYAAIAVQRAKNEHVGETKSPEAVPPVENETVTRLQSDLRTRDATIKDLESKLRDANASADMYANAWVRELGGTTYNKRHHIDACVVTTRAMVSANKAMFAVLRQMRDDLHTRWLADYIGQPLDESDWLSRYADLLKCIDRYGGKLSP